MEVLIQSYSWNGNPHVCCMCIQDGRKRLGEERSGCPCTLVRWKALKSPERKKTLAGQKSNSQGHQREREENLPNFFFYPAAHCVCGQTADLLWKLWVTVYEIYIQTCKLLGNLRKPPSLQWPGFLFHISLYVEPDRYSFSYFQFGLACFPKLLHCAVIFYIISFK